MIDWLTCTIKNMSADDVITKVLKMDSTLFESQSKGVNFYTSSKVYNNIRVLYDGYKGVTVDMGVCVTMSGEGVRVYEEYHGEDVLELIRRLVAMANTNITRIDIACDDRAGFLDMQTIWKYAQEDSYRSRMRTKRFFESYKNSNVGAKSVYFGSSSSMFKIRIYDKSAQLYAPDNPLFGVHWNRFEIVLRDIYAMQTSYILAGSNDIERSVSGIINDKFCFIERETDSNISRCKPSLWWIEFLENLDYIKLEAKPRVKHTVETHADWLDFACSRIISKVHKSVGTEKFNQLLKSGEGKLKDSDIAQIEDYKRRYGKG
jgi:DNA relaxase NicK